MPTLLGVTPNPVIDHSIRVPQLNTSAVHRATNVDNYAGGKGMNVVRAAHTLGCRTIGVGLLGGHIGRMMADVVAAEGLDAEWYWLESGETRITVLITQNNADTTVINEPGPTILRVEWLGFLAHIRQLAKRSEAIAFSGSLPPGADPEEFCELARSLVNPNCSVYLDASGEVLRLALAQPDDLCIKVNRAELAAGLQKSLDGIADVVKAGKMLLTRGAAKVVVTLGSEGAVVVAQEGCWQANSPSINVVSTVGSGNSMLAGFAVAILNGESVKNALKLGVACGAANAMSHLPGRFEQKTVVELLAQVNVKEIV